MKVKKIENTNQLNIASKNIDTKTGIHFSEVIAKKKDQNDYEKFQKMIEDIDNKGDILKDSCSIEDLRNYKKTVKEFLNEVVENGLKVHQSRGFGRGGRMKLFKTVQTVDKKLLELSDAVINSKDKGLHVLKLVGEIKGLLLDIYA